jgi:hypothetical protein
VTTGDGYSIAYWNIDLGAERAANVFINDVRTKSWDLFLETFARTFLSYADVASAIARMRVSIEPAALGPHDDPRWDQGDTPQRAGADASRAARRTPTLTLV